MINAFLHYESAVSVAQEHANRWGVPHLVMLSPEGNYRVIRSGVAPTPQDGPRAGERVVNILFPAVDKAQPEHRLGSMYVEETTRLREELRAANDDLTFLVAILNALRVPGQTIRDRVTELFVATVRLDLFEE